MYKQREIVLIRYPFSDFSNFKLRPVLVVSNNNYNQTFPDILLCGITSNLFQDAYSIPLNNMDLESGFLPHSSVIKCHILHSIDASLIIKKVALITDAKFTEVLDRINALISISNVSGAI
jgi:mRNA interferase MazF